MISAQIEKWIYQGEAEPIIIPFALSALASIKMDPSRPLIVYGFQVFPFFDISDEEITGSVIPPVAPLPFNERVWRGVHYFEFSSENKTHGFIHRSNFSTQRETDAALPVVEIPIPNHGADFFPVFLIYRGENLTMRVLRLPAPAEGGVTPGLPPQKEAGNPSGIAAAVPVLVSGLTYGAAAADNFTPDSRQPVVSAVSPGRPKAQTPSNVIQIANTTSSIISHYSYPVVNVYAIQLKSKELLDNI